MRFFNDQAILLHLPQYIVCRGVRIGALNGITVLISSCRGWKL